MDKIKVSICCITYNHELYLEECLNSLLNQKVDFLYEIIISNDCSTDNTQSIIDKYKAENSCIIDISPPRNLGATNNFYYTLSKARGEYIAYCEGDDYWVDQTKLTTQVSFLDKNPRYGLVYTYSTKKIDGKAKANKKMIYKCNTVNRAFVRYSVPAQTLLFRNELFQQYVYETKEYALKWLMADFPLVLWFIINSKIKQLKKQTAVYRVLPLSANHHDSFEKAFQFISSVNDVKLTFRNLYNLKISEAEIYNQFYYSMMWKCISFQNMEKYIFYSRKLKYYNFRSLFLKLFGALLVNLEK